MLDSPSEGVAELSYCVARQGGSSWWSARKGLRHPTLLRDPGGTPLFSQILLEAHPKEECTLSKKVSNYSSMDSNEGRSLKWKQRKRGGRHGKGPDGNGKRGGQSNKNRRLFYKRRSAHERIRCLHCVFGNPDVINHIGEFCHIQIMQP